MILEIHDMDTKQIVTLKSNDNNTWKKLSFTKKRAVKCFLAVLDSQPFNKNICLGRIVVYRVK